ncbi:hypothetical protein M4D55_24925 [Metabacillus idriensis]|uniref:hypothetical protein n=1 Tax=Metabacillus idriensis TaxID=324768 RepID=UPI001748D256|nr:hypothetical protein [Metabacillus idriensis]MCM3598984.1 hypothetical protein [Metabacillus idriensis]
MKISDLYLDAIEYKEPSLLLLLDFLLYEKQAISMDDDVSELGLYFKENNKQKMNALLLEYQQNGGANEIAGSG